MTELILSVAEITVTMAIVILLLLVLFKIFGKHMKAKSRYLILSIVLFRLALPFDLPGIPTLFSIELTASPTSIDSESDKIDLPEDSMGAQAEKIPSIPQSDAIGNISNQRDTFTSDADNISDGEDAPKVDSIPFYKKISGEDWLKLIFYVYFTGVFVFLGSSLFAHFLYIQRIKKGRTLGEEHVYSIYANVCRENGIINPPLLWESTVADSPMILGIIVPRIVIPAGLDENALPGMLEHELKHYTRRDLWIKFVCLIARSLHWFNPLVHIASMQCVQEMELSCDADVLADCDLETRRKYGNAMLDIVRRCSNRGISLTTHFSPRKKAVKDRFAGIVDMQNKKRGLWLILITILLCILSGILISCSVSISSIIDSDNDSENTDFTDDNTAFSTEVTDTDAVTAAPEVVTTQEEPEVVSGVTEETTSSVPEETTSGKPVEDVPKIVNTYKGDGYTVYEWSANDKAQAFWNIELDNGQRIKYTLEGGVSSPPDISEVVTFADVNFDGLKDMLVCKGAYGVRENIYYLCYLNVSGEYTLCKGFDQISNPTIDSDKKLIYGTQKDGIETSEVNVYGLYDNAFVLYDTAEESTDDTTSYVFYQTDFSDKSVLNDFAAFQGKWDIYDGRLWLTENYSKYPTIAETCSFLLYAGEDGKDLTDYTIDVDMYNVQTQAGVLMRCNFSGSGYVDSNSFYGYFLFVSKNGRKGAIGLGNRYGEWGGNLLVEDASFGPGYDLHLHAVVSGDTLRCVYSNLHTGEILLDIQCSNTYWAKGTFGFRVLSSYDGLTSLKATSFDNLVVTCIS